MLIVTESTTKIERKAFQIQIAAIASVLVFSNLGSALGQSRPAARAGQTGACEFVARIISGDIRLAAGKEVCKEDYLQSANDSTVEVLCYESGKILQLKNGAINERCLQRSNNQAQVCIRENRFSCFKVKGPGEDENVPTLITPYSPLILNPRPVLSWTPVSNAMGYIVQIKGPRVDWSMDVNSTSLLYPQEQPAMQPGIIYQVNVLAKMAEQKFIPKSSILMVMPSLKAQRTKAVIERVQSLNLSPDSLAVDLTHIYKAEDLFSEAIEVLKERIQAKTKNPTIYRLLGDRYLEVGLPIEASHKYKIAIQYSKLRGNSVELAKAQTGLELSRQSQLPTRINPAQK
ncbi:MULTISPECIES: tetratricopeptide repeat protein [Nostoc]|uniref:Tetratricopeptide repeat protein n=2 Tax=Nostoc TaxID=1177 RepID=A0ABR8IE43_9NOSO|nr:MULTISPECIES: hypothetical protein [Nostoc]MBD2564092.1 hypothetical protein [Nostoc linckia FACHB-391]MBD2649831.1 hypothetical protein [Nostoc foliaceum FACHB-393]